jgi:2-polyprenyl-6-methoxyphenol hydroxylase-like FAD-dependent oxidoreductase
VTLLEARAGDGAAPGETLHPGVEPLFRTLGLDQGLAAMNFHRHAGVWSRWDTGLKFTPYGDDQAGPWLGFQAERSRLHALLRTTAAEAGAQIHRPCAPRTPLFENGRVAGVATGDQTYSARWTLDATGRRAWLARALRLKNRWRSPRLQLRFGWRKRRASDLSNPVICARPGGWDWRAPIDDQRLAWVTLRIPEPAAARETKPGDFAWRIHEPAAGPGYFLLGDAAALLDPLAAHGVLHALMSGMLAAHLIAACKGGQLSEQLAQADYCNWVEGRFEHDVAALTALYARHPFGLRLAPLADAAPHASGRQISVSSSVGGVSRGLFKYSSTIGPSPISLPDSSSQVP